MRFVFPQRTGTPQSLRSRLFVEALFQRTTAATDHNTFTEPDADTIGLSGFEVLGQLSPHRHAKTSVFVGLPRSPALLVGQNILICTRPLGDEISALAAEIGTDADVSDLWVGNLLSSFEKTIFLERYDLQESRGFAPWCPLKLTDRYPLLLPGRTTEPPEGIAIFLHDPRAFDADFRKHLTSLGTVDEVTNATESHQLAQILARRALHVHVGWSPKRPTAGLSPFDSLCSGVYTLLSLPTESNVSILGSVLIRMISERSYAEISQDYSRSLDTIAAMLARARTYCGNGFRANPELARHAFANSAVLTDGVKRLEECIPS